MKIKIQESVQEHRNKGLNEMDEMFGPSIMFYDKSFTTST